MSRVGGAQASLIERLPRARCEALVLFSLMPPPSSPGPWRAAWSRLCQSRSALVALAFLALVSVACVAGPWVSPYAESDQHLERVAQPPSLTHWMGTDLLGRDLATRVLSGGRISLAIGLVATVVAMSIGVAYGLVAGMAGGRVDNLLMRLVDVLYGFPFIAFVILMYVTFSQHATVLWFGETLGIDARILFLFVAIGAVEWLTTARVVRGQVLGLKNQEFVLAARVAGAGTVRVLWHHLVPNLLGQVIIYASLTVPGILLLEAVLSFLGLGVQPPRSSWGTLIQEGANNMETSPWLLAFPGVFFIATLLALNTLGDALRDALDPKARST